MLEIQYQLEVEILFMPACTQQVNKHVHSWERQFVHLNYWIDWQEMLYIHGSQRMNHHNFGDPLIFQLHQHQVKIVIGLILLVVQGQSMFVLAFS